MKHVASRLAILALVLALITTIVASAAMTMPASAATSGPLDAGTGANMDGPGTINWTDPANITATGAPYATAVITGGATSEYLQGTNYGFSIPLDATIDGITVSIMRMDSAGNGTADSDLYLLKASAIAGNNHASTVKWPVSMTVATYGGTADLWGTTWTPSEVNATSFGVSLSAYNTHPVQPRTASVDYMRITITYTPATTPTTLTVSAAAGTYCGTANLTATLSPAVAGRTISFTLNGVSAGTADTDGSGVANIPAADLTGIDAGTYPTGVGASFAGDASYGASSGSNSLTVNVRNITVAADGRSKTYGDADPALTYQITSGSLVGTDSFTGALTRVAGENVGDYDILQGTLALSINYNLTFVEGTFTLSTRSITVTADNKSKTYGDADPALTYQITSGSLVGTDSFTGALTRVAGENVGDYDILQGTLALSSNYNLTFVEGTFTISTRSITVTADDKGKTYGEADPGLTCQITSGSLAFTDAFSGTLTRVAGENVGAYGIQQGTLVINDGNGGNNYAFTFVSGEMAIKPRELTVTGVVGVNKTYDGSTNAAVDFSTAVLLGLISGDDVVVDISGAGAMFADRNVGSGKTVTVTGLILTGADAGNYTLPPPSTTADITPKVLTVTADNRSKTYGDVVTFAGTEFSAAGLVNGDAVSSVALTSSGATAGATVASGPYAIVPSAAVGSGLGNYTISYVNGNLTVNPKALTITAGNRSKTYGDTVTFAGTEFAVTGLEAGDTVTTVSLISTGAAAGAAAGTYTITPSAAVGTGLGNYTITYVSGTLTVNEGIPPVKTPVVDDVSPESGPIGETLDVIIEGTDFTGATAVDFGPGITVNTLVVNSPTRITANITIDPAATPGLRDIVVTTPSGGGTLTDAFTITGDSPGGSGSWWFWLPLALLPIIVGLLLFFLLFKRRKKKTPDQSRASSPKSH